MSETHIGTAERGMTDAEINDYVTQCIREWIEQGVEWMDMICIAAGMIGTVCMINSIPNEKAHEMLALLLRQREGYHD